ncbi:adenosylcobinamide-phosphate synthase CbiB [Nocardioides aequoreus]|uniref:adenosylcobinamide-phosphate synthase CbiB n=1 Tax=Nocardioides aequoreus TaxID=397278 RepID=UPI0009FF09B0|nr:adenosylcobinamide-phosphate synthase CbiB [Nocardioides aequoreus]
MALALEHRLHPPGPHRVPRPPAALRRRGVAHVVVLVGGAAAFGVLLERATSDRPTAHVLATAAATWAVLGGTSLEREAHAVAGLLERRDLPAARQRLTHLVGRDPSRLDEDEVARAVVESVAENTSDAVVAPLVLGAVLGVPGLVGHRAANTLDAMVGLRSERYADFGWASARLDDLLALPGSRLSALLAVGLGHDHVGAWRTWRRDAPGHPSPNAGPVEAAFAGALGVRLGGRNTYGDRVEHRHLLGDGPPPRVTDVRRATALARRVDAGAILLAAMVAGLGRRRAASGLPLSPAGRPRRSGCRPRGRRRAPRR